MQQRLQESRFGMELRDSQNVWDGLEKRGQSLGVSGEGKVKDEGRN